VYSLPGELQIPLFNLALCFFVLMLQVMRRRSGGGGGDGAAAAARSPVSKV
jgi:hypothetical protein